MIKMKNLAQEITECFKPFSDTSLCSFHHYNYSGKDTHCAYIEIAMLPEKAERLQGDINSYIPLSSGARAHIYFLDIRELTENLRLYSAQIIPEDFVPQREKAKAADDFLRQLPHALQNILIKKSELYKKRKAG